MSEANLVQCYNKGCGVKFDPSMNDAGACIYHPGEPVFHDADKLWSCCNKRSKDFTQFLGMPGCVSGTHNPNKPVEAPKSASTPQSNGSNANTRKPVKQQKIRPPLDSKFVTLVPTVSASLKQLLAKERESQQSEVADDVDPQTGIKMGEPCKRNGCKATYEGAASSLELCKFHPGGPVFHEGMKYWSCCNRKTTDFSEFLDQVGCSTEKHQWKDDTSSSQKTDCRYDWHQTGSHVYVTVYAKGTQPSASTVSVSPVRLCATLRHANNLQFDLDLVLAGIIDPSQCSATFAATKAEFKLKKDEPVTWARLQMERRQTDASETAVRNGCDDGDVELSSEQQEAALALDVDAVDLSDL